MTTPRPIRVLCVVPRGLKGRGGIETLFSHVDEKLRSDPDAAVTMDFMASRGDAAGPGWVMHFPFALARQAWLLATRRYDIVHLNAATNASAWRKWLMQSLSHMAGVATVVHFHGSAFPRPGDPRPAWVPILRRVFERANAIVVLGAYWRDFVSHFYGMPAKRFSVIANGVADFANDAPEPRKDGAPVQMLFAGNLTDAKGARNLLHALAELSEDLPEWHMVFAGAGDVAAFCAEAERLGIADRAEFAGWLDRDHILPLYQQADIVVLPSRNEVLPVCLLEGACAGAALVATPVGSVPDVLHNGMNGILVKPDNPQDLAKALAELIGDAKHRNAFRTASREIYLERFRLDTMIDALITVYQRALSTKR